MKRLLLFVSLLLAPCSLLTAAEPAVEVISLSEVRIDGVNAGQLADVIANHRHLASSVQAAALKWSAAQKAAAGAELAKMQADLTAAEARAAAAEAKSTEALAKVDAIIPILDIVEASALPAEHRAALRAARKSEVEKRRAALEAELAKLPANP